MTCRICAWFCARLDCGPQHASFWREMERWEQARSNDWELWSHEPEPLRELNERAAELSESAPEEALRLRLEAADAGSAWAMQYVGRQYHLGGTAEPDFEQAKRYYLRAIGAGSNMATILYARLLAQRGNDGWLSLLEEGVQADFIPAFYWLARLRYSRSKDRKTAHEIAPLLEYAVDQGHPGAEILLGRLLLSGKLGIRGMPRGFRMFRAFVAGRSKTGETGETEEADSKVAPA